MDKAVITCALSGVAANRQQCPYLPYTPDEFGEEARRAREAGAAVVHVRARNPETGGPVHDVDGYQPILDAIRERAPDVLVSFATFAQDVSREQRVGPARELHPDVASVAMGSITYGIWSRDQRRFLLDTVQATSFADVSYVLSALRRAGVKPDLTCFDAGHLANVRLALDAGMLDAKPYVSLVMGVHGGLDADVGDLAHVAGRMPDGAHWQVVGTRQPDQWRMVAAGLALGGSVRVGLEDNFYVDEGRMATSNGELVAKAARMVSDVGRTVAEPEEARALIGASKAVPA